MTPLESARAVADAVLYEGYVLYPYRATSSKNQVRWQWGVLMPPTVVALDPSERSANHTEVVVDGGDPSLRLTVRFLQVQRRTVEAHDEGRWEPVERLEVGDTAYLPWDEAQERELPLALRTDTEEAVGTTLDVEGGAEEELLHDGDGRLVGRLTRTREPVVVRVVTVCRRPPSPYQVAMVSVRVENATAVSEPGPNRPRWLRHALVACHLLLEVEGGAFVSSLDPPEWAKGYVEECANVGVFPVLGAPVGHDDVVLSSPIILYDHPELAPQSESVFFDALEVDELLSLRTMTLSEEEKREVRGTDPRAAALLREVDDMPPELWERLHGTVRYLDSMTALAPPRPATTEVPLDVPWWDPGSDASVDPESDTVRINEMDVGRGTRVILRPGIRRADAYDLFLAGRIATVAAVLHDVDDGEHLAVTVDDDPGSDLKTAHGRYLYFAPDEVEPLPNQRERASS